MALIETALTRIDFIPWEAVLLLWAVYGALFLPFTWEGKPDPKRRLYARYVIMGAVLLILTPFAVGFPLGVSVLLIGPAVLLVWGCLWRSPFCPTCGVVVTPLPPFSPPQVCARCGADIAKS
jgi:hypothetical protein